MAPRTGLYGTVMHGNAAADNTVDDYGKMSTLIGDKQYIAGFGGGAAGLNNGAFSFSGAGFNWFGSALGGAAPDDVRLGMANRTFGAGLFLSMAKTAQDLTGPGGETRTTLESDGYGLFGDFNLGNSDVYGELGLLTGFGNLADALDNFSTVIPVGSTVKTTTTNNYFHLMGGWKKHSTTEGTHALNAELTFNLSNKEDPNGAPADTAQIMELIFGFYHGVILRQTAGLSVVAGSNTQIMYQAQTENALNPPADRSHSGISVRPNLGFQKTLGNGFETFAGAGVTLGFDTYDNMMVAGTNWALFTAGTDMALGLRWNYENFAFEGSVSEILLSNGPNMIGGGAPGLFGRVGVSLGF